MSTPGTAALRTLCVLHAGLSDRLNGSPFDLDNIVYEHEKHKTDFNTGNKTSDLTVPGVIR